MAPIRICFALSLIALIVITLCSSVDACGSWNMKKINNSVPENVTEAEAHLQYVNKAVQAELNGYDITYYSTFQVYYGPEMTIWYSPYSWNNDPCNVSVVVTLYNKIGWDITAGIWNGWQFAPYDYQTGVITNPPQNIPTGDFGWHVISIDSSDRYMYFEFGYYFCDDYPSCWSVPYDGTPISVSSSWPCNQPHYNNNTVSSL